MPHKTITDSFLALSTEERVSSVFGNNIEVENSPKGLYIGKANYKGKQIAFAASRAEVQMGTLGVEECETLTRFVNEISKKSDAFVYFVDSAGARLEEGLPLQGALRKTMRAFVDSRLDGFPSASVFGRNVFGGASLLAYALEAQFYSSVTRLAMTGPRVLERLNNSSQKDVAKILSSESRCEVAAIPLCRPGEQSIILQNWIENNKTYPKNSSISLKNRVREAGIICRDGILNIESTNSIICSNNSTPNVAELMALASSIEQAPNKSNIFLGWNGHSTNLKDEYAIQSEILAHLSIVLRKKTKSGDQINLIITGEISGGLYIAMAAGASSVSSTSTGKVLTLGADVLQDIFKNNQKINIEIEDQIKSGTVDFISK